MANTKSLTSKSVGIKHKHVFSPRGGCKEVFDARDEEVLISGPAGTGKSRACLEKIHMMCMLTADVRALLLRKTMRSLGSSALVTWRNFVIKEALLTGDVVYYGGSSQEAAQYRYKNGSTVTIGGLDNPARVMSSEYDIIYIQEATEVTIEDIEYVKTRLRNWKISFQQLLMDCNPSSDKHPLKLRCNDKRCILIESRHEDNPRLFDLLPDGKYKVTEQGAKYMSILDNLTGVRHKRLRLGLWVSAEGIIYEEFDPAIHLLDWEYDDDNNRLPLPIEWPRYWVIDFGYVHPFVCKMYAEGPDGELYMYREFYHTKRTVEEHAKQIMDTVTRIEYKEFEQLAGEIKTVEETIWLEPKPTAVICDHDAEDRRTFERHTGLGTQAANKSVSTGIDLVKARLKPDERGYPGFYIMRDALVERDQDQAMALLPTCTEDEYPAYVWKVNTQGRTMDEPVKYCDDGVDTDRYMIMFKDFKGKARATQL